MTIILSINILITDKLLVQILNYINQHFQKMYSLNILFKKKGFSYEKQELISLQFTGHFISSKNSSEI